MITFSPTKRTCAALAASLALGGLATLPAHAATLAGGGSVFTGSDFTTAFGSDGYLVFDTSAAGQTSGDFDTGGAHDALVANNGPNAASTTTIVQPSYVSGFTGFTVDHASGYNYQTILPGSEAGLVGGSGGNIFSFTVGANAPASFLFGVLTNYSSASEDPATLTLTSGAATASDTGTSVEPGGFNNLFTVTNAAAGDVFTVAASNGYISGATFDSSAPVPEASTSVSLGLMFALGLGGLLLKTRRRKANLA